MFLGELILMLLGAATFIWFMTTILVSVELVYLASMLGPARFYCGIAAFSAVVGMAWSGHSNGPSLWIRLLLICLAIVLCPLRLLLSRVVRLPDDPISSSSDYKWMLIASSVSAGIICWLS